LRLCEVLSLDALLLRSSLMALGWEVQMLSCSPWWPVKLLQNWFLHQNSSKIEFVLSSKFGYPQKLVKPLGNPEFFKTLVINPPF
jgi:hypothetical protein